MKTTPSRKPKWPMHVTVGNVTVTVYRRTTPNGKKGFMLAYQHEGKRKFDSYSDEATAIQEANTKARRLSTLGVKAAQLTEDDLRVCVAAMDAVKPLNLPLGRAVEKLLEAVEIVGDVSKVVEACKFFAARHKTVTAKRVADAVAELITIKKARGASLRYVQDLQNRLARFAGAFQKDAGNVTTADIMAWFDSQKFSPQNFMGFRRVIHLLFEFAVARGYAADNPAAALERVKVKHGATQVFTPQEIVKLLASASPEFLPCIAIGAFAGLRSAEIERLEWSDIHLAEKFIVVGADKAKTASRRVVPVSDNLAMWLAPYAGHKGKVWTGGHDQFYDAQQDAAENAGLKWKANALRHSAASYMFALSNDAGRIAGFLGNSASVVHKHYRELVRPADATKWFSVKPDAPANILPMNAATVARVS